MDRSQREQEKERGETEKKEKEEKERERDRGGWGVGEKEEKRPRKKGRGRQYVNQRMEGVRQTVSYFLAPLHENSSFSFSINHLLTKLSLFSNKLLTAKVLLHIIMRV